jgi:glycosyltransferase involved in cell wall biosynthesis
VLVNGSCDATREHAERSGGGLWFSGYGSFEGAVDRLAHDDRLRSELAAAGLAYLDRLYRWPRLIDRYANFLTSVAGRRALH